MQEELAPVIEQYAIPFIAALLAVFWFVAAATSRKANPGTAKLALIGGVLATLMAIALLAVIVLKVRISAVVAIPLFVAAIVEFGFIIAYVARTTRGRVSQRVFMVGVLTIIGSILIGIVLMFQPWTPKVFNLGFDFVLIALLAFNIWSHIAPRPEEHK
jgi:hypothetical protein